MGKFEAHEVDPKQYDVSRRRFLRNAGVAAASVPLMGGLMDVLTERGASAQTHRDESHPLFATLHPNYKFTFVNHVTTEHVLHRNPVRAGQTPRRSSESPSRSGQARRLRSSRTWSTPSTSPLRARSPVSRRR